MSKNYPGGPSLDMDERGDPKVKGYGGRLGRDLAVERGQIALDVLPPSHVRRRCRREKKQR